MFQLRAGPFTSCEEWTVSNTYDYKYDNYINFFLQISTEDSIKSFIRSAVVDTVIDNCECGFLDSFIAQEMLLCDTQNPTQAVYRAQVFNFGSISSTEIVSWIEDWVLNEASVTSGPILVTFDPTCPAQLNSINEEICQQEVTISAATSSLGVIVGSVLAVGCIVIICIVAVVMVTFYFHLKSKKRRFDMIQ